MAISCVYCGGSHSAAAQVRACWQRHSGREASSDSPPINGSVARRGPPELARNLITDPATPVPVDWHGVSRIAIGTEDVASPTALIGRLRQMAEAR
ncbi:MAG: hypothetical protein ABIQ39_12425, partial [Ilumatobacteraceae bacterium]